MNRVLYRDARFKVQHLSHLYAILTEKAPLWGGVTPCDDLYGEAPPEWGILGLHHQNHTNIGKTKFFHPVVFAAKVVYNNNINNNNYNYNNNN